MFFFFKQKTAYEIASCLVGSEMCIRDRRSTSGYLLKFMGGPLLAVSRRQKNVTLSSCEAEYCTFTDCAKDILWAKGLAKFFKCPFPEPAELRCDNVTAKHMAEGKAKLNRTRNVSFV